MELLPTLILQFKINNPELWIIFIATCGLLMGSFINMLCYRLPIILEWKDDRDLVNLNQKSISIVSPRSFCPLCEHTIYWWQNIPLISYLILRGKCHFCKQTITPQYLIIELLCLFMSITIAVVIDNPTHTLWWLIFTWIALALAIIDSRHLLLPDGLNYALLWSGLLFSTINDTAELAIISGVIGYTSFWSINYLYALIRKRQGIGQGDFKLLAGIAVWFGWYELPSIVLLGSVLGLCYALFMLYKHKTFSLNQTIPFAPFLLFSSWSLLIFSHAF